MPLPSLSNIAARASCSGLLILAQPASGADPQHAAQVSPERVKPVASAPEPARLTKLADGVYVLGGEHNAGLIVGPNGAILVDSRVAGDYDVLHNMIAQATRQPVRYVVSTHYHPDHVGSNDRFHRDGAQIVGHANLARRMLAPPEPNPHTGLPLDPAPADALPTITYTDQMTLDMGGGIEAQLVHLPAAHTDGDTLVMLPAQNVIFVGDLAMMCYSPPDILSGGTLEGLVAAADFIIAHANAATRIVPGHFRIMSKADVVAFRAMLITARDRISHAKAQGMTEDQVFAAHLLADMDKTWMASGGPVIESFPRLVYREVP